MAFLTETLKTNDTLRSAARFLVVGMLGTLIDLALFAVLHLLLGIPTLAANTLSYSAGVVNNYFFHRYWTYAHRSQSTASKEFSQFVGVSLSAMVLNNLIVMVLSPSLVTLFLNPTQGAVLAKICATALGMSWNFLANHLWTFRTVSQYKTFLSR